MSNFLIMFELGGAEALWGARIERAIREAMSEKSGKEGSAAIAERVKSLGLRPYRPPEALPPVEEDEIQLICWMEVEK
jgi:hypothetical protein